MTEQAAAAKKMPSGANAPYKIVPSGAKFLVKNNAGETKATFDDKAKALDYLQALYANVKGAAARAAKTKFTGTAKNRAPKTATACLDSACTRTFFDEALLADHVHTVHPQLDAAMQTPVESDLVGCYDPACDRAFRGFQGMVDHAEAVHTFDDIRQMVAEELSEYFGKQTDDYKTSIYVYLVDIADDWAVFQASQGNDQDLYKVSYSVVDGDVTFGTPIEVVRRTVYDPVAPDTDGNDAYTGVLDPDNGGN